MNYIGIKNDTLGTQVTKNAVNRIIENSKRDNKEISNEGFNSMGYEEKLAFLKQNQRLKFDEQDRFAAMTFNGNDIETFHKKNFKGVFFQEYGHPLPNDFDIVVIFDESEGVDFLQEAVGHLEGNYDWKISGSSSVFKYIIQPYRQIKTLRPEKSDEIPTSEDNVFLSLFRHDSESNALVFALKKKVARNIKGKGYLRKKHEAIPAQRKEISQKEKKKKKSKRKITKASKRINRKNK